MKNPQKVIIIALVALVAIFVLRSCSLSNRLSYLKGMYEDEKKINKENTKQKLIEIEELQGKINELNGAIDSSNKVIIDTEERLEDADSRIAKLERKYLEAKTDAAKVENLLEQVDEWKGKFSLAEVQLEEKDKIIFSLNEKYDAQVGVTENYMNLWLSEKQLRETGEKRITALNWEVRRLKVWNFAEKVVIAAAVGYFVYDHFSSSAKGS